MPLSSADLVRKQTYENHRAFAPHGMVGVASRFNCLAWRLQDQQDSQEGRALVGFAGSSQCRPKLTDDLGLVTAWCRSTDLAAAAGARATRMS